MAARDGWMDRLDRSAGEHHQRPSEVRAPPGRACSPAPLGGAPPTRAKPYEASARPSISGELLLDLNDGAEGAESDEETDGEGALP
eukprot:5602085-Prymnesium_polylepis.1